MKFAIPTTLFALATLTFSAPAQTVDPPSASNPPAPAALKPTAVLNTLPEMPAPPGPRPTPVPALAGDVPVAAAAPVQSRELDTRLQIFLDQQLFGPGKIDGRSGEFTVKALKAYQRAHDLPETGVAGPEIPLDSVHPIYIAYEITPEDAKQVGEIPKNKTEQAKKKKTPYTSLLEFVAERYHSDPEFLVKLNRGNSLETLKPGDIVRVPNVAPFKIEEVPELKTAPEQPNFLNRSVTIDTAVKMLELTEGDKILAAFPITPGSAKLPAPKGTWKILGIVTLPNFRWDEMMLNHGQRSDTFYMLPPGPNNPVGVAWIGLNKPGIGLHGTNSPDTIGRSASHGCIRLANWDAIRLVSMVTKGMKVTIK